MKLTSHTFTSDNVQFYVKMSSRHLRSLVVSSTAVPDRKLIRHHDLVVRVGHQQPYGVLQDALDELLLAPTAAPRRLLTGVVVLRRVDAAEVLAGVAALAAA